MSQPIADDFIAELSSTIKKFEARSDAAPEMTSLIELSNHMVAALEALKMSLSKPGKSSHAA